MANLKGTVDAEGFCFHKIYECSEMIAVAGSKIVVMIEWSEMRVHTPTYRKAMS